MNKITDFHGKHRFLSNFYPSSVWFDKKLYPTVEHAYQAAKTLRPEEREQIRLCSTPGQAKRLGKILTLQADWEQLKLSTMDCLTRQKFEAKYLRDKLLSTGDAELVEENSWGDTFWGVCQGVGENHLGKILMKIREELAG